MGLYANIRPANFASESLLKNSPLKEEVARGTNIIVLRELIGGACESLGQLNRTDQSLADLKEDFGKRQETDSEGVAWDTTIYSIPEVERITRVAAQIALAVDPPLPIHSIDKANVLATSRLWRKVVTDVLKAEYPQLTLDHQLVDSAAMIMVSNPRKLNGVVLTENMFGDMWVMFAADQGNRAHGTNSLSDESSVIPGSLGLLPSASLAGAPDPKVTVMGVYEP